MLPKENQLTLSAENFRVKFSSLNIIDSFEWLSLLCQTNMAMGGVSDQTSGLTHTNPENQDANTSPAMEDVDPKPADSSLSLANRIDLTTENFIKETTNAMGTVSTSSEDSFSFNVYGTVETPTPANLRPTGIPTTSPILIRDFNHNSPPSSTVAVSDTTIPNTSPLSHNEGGEFCLKTLRTRSADRVNSGLNEVDSFHTPPTSKNPSKLCLSINSGQISSGYLTGSQQAQGLHLSAPLAPAGQNGNTSLTLPPFLTVNPGDKRQTNQDSFAQIHRISTGFFERSKELHGAEITLDRDLHSRPPLAQRTKELFRASPHKPSVANKYKQLKLTSLLEKRAEGPITRKEGDPETTGWDTHPLPHSTHTPDPINSDSTISIVGDSHPPRGQGTPEPHLGDSFTLINVGRRNRELSPPVDSTPIQSDLTILDNLARSDLDWTTYTECNRWGDTPPPSAQHSVETQGGLHPPDKYPKSVHFTPLGASVKQATDKLSLSISQLEIGEDDGDQLMREETTGAPSLAEALGGTSTTTSTDDDHTSTITTPTPVELPYLAEVTWKQARGATRAGIKARTYARHLVELSDDDDNPIITPWALGTAPLPPYITEDKGLLTKISTARKLAARGLQRLVADELMSRANDQLESAQFQLERAEYLTRKSGCDEWPKANEVLTNMMAKEQAILTNKLIKRKSWLTERQPTLTDWQNYSTYLSASLRGAHGAKSNPTQPESLVNQGKDRKKGPNLPHTSNPISNPPSTKTLMDFTIPRTTGRPGAPSREGNGPQGQAKRDRGKPRNRSKSRKNKSDNHPSTMTPANPERGRKRQRNKEDVPPTAGRSRSRSCKARKQGRSKNQKDLDPNPNPPRREETPAIDKKWQLISMLLDKI